MATGSLGTKRWWAEYAYTPKIIGKRLVWCKWYQYEVERCRAYAGEFESYLTDHAGNKWHYYWKRTGERKACEQPAKLDKMAWPY
jgi:hypothetical protein